MRLTRLLAPRMGKQGEGVFSYMLDIRGVNNADTYVYLNATERSQYKSLSLYALAVQLDLTQKATMPVLTLTDISSMVDYCMVDSDTDRIHLDGTR